MTDEPVRDHFAFGCLAAFLLTAFCGGALMAINLVFQGGFGMTVGLPLLLGFGVVQLAWLGPLVIAFWRAGKRQTAYGAMVFGGLVALCNGGCWLMMAGAFDR